MGQPGPVVKLDIVGARGEGIYDTVRRLGLGGAASDATDAQAAAAYAQWLIDNFDGTDLAEILAAAAIAQEYGSIFSTPFDEIAASAPGAPSDGDKYLNTGDGKAYIRVDGAWVAYTPREGQPAYVTDTGLMYKAVSGAWVAQNEKVVVASQFASLAAAVTFADAAGASLTISTEYALTGDLAIPATIPEIDWQAEVDFGNYNITFNNQFIRAGARSIWKLSGTGVPLGSIKNNVLYPEWTGAIGTDNVAGIAAATANRKAINALELFDSQTANACRWLDFTGITYGLDLPITNPVAGRALRWRGHGSATTRIFAQGTGNDAVVRIMVGSGSGSNAGVFMKGLGIYGDAAAGTAARWNLEIRDWCSFEHEDCLYDFNNSAVYVRDYAPSQYTENYKGRRNVYGPDIKGTAAILCQTTGGTGSFRGFSEREFLWSRSTSSCPTLLYVDNSGGEFLYNGGDLQGVVTNHTTQACWVVDCLNGQGVRFARSSLDLEQTAGGGSITIGKTGLVALGGGYTANGTITNIKAGTAVFGVSQVLDGVIERIAKGWTRLDPYSVTGTGSPFVVNELSYPAGTRKVTLKIDAGFAFQAFVEATIIVDDIGTNHQILNKSVTIMHNSAGLSLATSDITVGGTGKLQFALALGANVAALTAHIEFIGG